MHKHALRYLLKQHDDGSYAGVMIDLDGVIGHGKSIDAVESELYKKSIFLIKNNNKLYQKVKNNTLAPKLRKSTLGNPQQIKTIYVNVTV